MGAFNEVSCQGGVRLGIGSAGFLWPIALLGNGVGMATLWHCRAQLNGVVEVLLWVGMALDAGHAWFRTLTRRGPAAVVRIWLSVEGSLTLEYRSGRRCHGMTRTRHLVTPWLVILAWNDERGRSRCPLVVACHGIDSESWRKFRVLLRHPL